MILEYSVIIALKALFSFSFLEQMKRLEASDVIIPTYSLNIDLPLGGRLAPVD